MKKMNKTLLVLCVAIFASFVVIGCSGEAETKPADPTTAAPSDGSAAGAGASVGTSEGMEVPEDAK